MAIRVRELVEAVEALAPRELAEAWDRVGLQVGAPEQAVDRVLLTVDVTRQVLDEAARKGAGAIVAHHPVLFGEVGSLRPDRWPGCVVVPLIEGRRALIVAHTNLDWSPAANTSAALAEALGLTVEGPLGVRSDGAYLGVLVGTEPLELGELAARAGRALGGSPPSVHAGGRRVRRVAVIAGSGKGLLARALELGAEAVVAGELGHHDALEAEQVGLGVVETGHSSSEGPGMARLGERLRERVGGACEVLSAT